MAVALRRQKLISSIRIAENLEKFSAYFLCSESSDEKRLRRNCGTRVGILLEMVHVCCKTNFGKLQIL
jgi:hypothetical protein